MIKRGTQAEKTRKILIFGAESVQRPGTQTWTSKDTTAGIEIEQSRPVGDLVTTVHRTDHADVINAFADSRKEVADFDSAFSVLLELPR